MSRVEGILNWYKENENNDPNMYELIEVLCQNSIVKDADDETIKSLVDLEVNRLFSNGIVKDENDSLVEVVREFEERALTGNEVPDELEDYAKKVAGVSFWIKQEEKNGRTVLYDNFNEYKEIIKFEEDTLKMGINISNSIKRTRAYIDVHCNESLNKLREHRFNSRPVNLTLGKDNNRMATLVMMAETYVYPEKFNAMYENVNTLLDATMETIIDLGKGLDFDTVKEKLDKKDISGFGNSFIVGQVALYAKNGPEFFVYSCEKDGEKLDDATFAWIEKLKDENKKLAEKYEGKVDSDNYSK